MPNIVILENQKLISEGLTLIIEGHSENKIVCSAHTEQQLLTYLSQNYNTVDLILMDIELNDPQRNGLDVAYSIREQYPAIRIIFLTSYRRCEFIVPVFGKFEGYLFKDAHANILRKAIEDVTTAGKGTYYDVEAMNFYYQCMQNKRPDLIPELVQTIIHMANGYTNPEIAEKLTTPNHFLTENSIRERRRKLRFILKAQNSAQIIAKAFKFGYISPDDIQ